MLWAYLREEEFDDAIKISKGVCAMAVGCLEKHGQHLPVGTDTLEANKVLETASEIEPVCVFPCFYFGDIQGLHQHKGSVILSGGLLLSLMTELCDEIARNGFKKILLFNGHGGNIAFLNNFIRTTLYRKKDYVVYTFFNNLLHPSYMLKVIQENKERFSYLTREDLDILNDYVVKKKTDEHGGFCETAGMLGTYPELVRTDKYEAERSASTKRFDHLTKAGIYTAHFWNADYPNSYAGDPPLNVNERIGKAYTQMAVDRAVNVLRILKNEEESLRFNEEWNRMW
jgi:creatinine amidohydrolase